MSLSQDQQFQESNARPDTVSDIVGLKVYTTSGVYVGTVDDLQLGFDQKEATGVALTDVNAEIQKKVDRNKKGVIIPYPWIEAVHDVVLVFDVIDRLNHRA